jgi:DUF2934 family protein
MRRESLNGPALWLARGRRNGHDRDDWLDAQHELRLEAKGESATARFHIVSLDDGAM